MSVICHHHITPIWQKNCTRHCTSAFFGVDSKFGSLIQSLFIRTKRLAIDFSYQIFEVTRVTFKKSCLNLFENRGSSFPGSSVVVFVLNLNFSPVVLQRFDQPPAERGLAEVAEGADHREDPGEVEQVVGFNLCLTWHRSWIVWLENFKESAGLDTRKSGGKLREVFQDEVRLVELGDGLRVVEQENGGQRQNPELGVQSRVSEISEQRDSNRGYSIKYYQPAAETFFRLSRRFRALKRPNPRETLLWTLDKAFNWQKLGYLWSAKKANDHF